ncbi:hypothetical protein Tsp_06408 [Trichinella spiralis]|uniref:hypothetical protein n=1 Tax=Trichinella spiralis TaxID=6334 RepID=UPI0001EFC2C0|nr:hypothetical protein Tsp_06408 [Trichinella spiralis]
MVGHGRTHLEEGKQHPHFRSQTVNFLDDQLRCPRLAVPFRFRDKTMMKPVQKQIFCHPSLLAMHPVHGKGFTVKHGDSQFCKLGLVLPCGLLHCNRKAKSSYLSLP